MPRRCGKGLTVHTMQSMLNSFFETNCHSIVAHLRVALALLGRDATSIPLLFALPFPSPRPASPWDVTRCRRPSAPRSGRRERDTMSLFPSPSPCPGHVASLRASFWDATSCCVPSRIVLGRDPMSPSLRTSFWEIVTRHSFADPLLTSSR